MYQVIFRESARKELASLQRVDQGRVLRKLDQLAINPRSAGTAKLEGVSGLYRIRAGDFRIIYSIDDGVRIVLIAKIGNRRDVYRDL